MTNPMWTCKPEKTAELTHLRSVNSASPYGAATVAYMDAWGSLMEAIITSEGVGALTPERIEQAGHDADTDGITGFMHGWSKSALQALWVHGDLLAAPKPTANPEPTP